MRSQDLRDKISNSNINSSNTNSNSNTDSSGTEALIRFEQDSIRVRPLFQQLCTAPDEVKDSLT